MPRVPVDPQAVEQFKPAILDLLKAKNGEPMAKVALIAATPGASKSKRAFKNALKELQAKGKIVKLSDERYLLSTGKYEAFARMKFLRNGRSIALPETELPPPFADAREIRIPQRGRETALHGDRVKVRLDRQRRDGTPSGVVISVLERETRVIVGKYYGGPRSGRVVPRDNTFDRPIVLPSALRSDQAENGEWIEVEITSYPPHPKPIPVTFLNRLGKDGDQGIDITVLLRSLGCAEEFPAQVMEQVEAIPDGLPDESLAAREDLRDLLTFTIDGADAKDFDDAISIDRTKDGNYMLGVHIADVSYYVRPGTALDEEARNRSTSIYPIDRVVPMLPERLSNDLCSLRPDVDRPTLTCEMVITPEGKTLSARVFQSVIHSKKRLTYEMVQSLFDTEDAGKPAAKELASVKKALLMAGPLAQALTKMRMDRGALDLDVAESQILLQDDGRTRGIVMRERFEAHKLIEEFMLAANEAVARHMRQHSLPTLYRIHDEPHLERLKALAPVIRGLGLPVANRTEWDAQQFQVILNMCKEHPAGPFVRRLMLRSLQRAEYNHKNIGHFGLAAPIYLHFTSPIRRYPDLLTHRALRLSWETKPKDLPRILAPVWDDLPGAGKHTSRLERQAMDIEYSAADIKAMEFMSGRVGEEYDARVADIISAGVFVELVEWPVRGMIPMRSLPGYWEFNDELILLKSRDSGQSLRIGDQVTVRVEKVEVLAGQMDVVWVRSEKDQNKSAGGQKPKSGRRRKSEKAEFGETKEPPTSSSNRRGGNSRSSSGKKSGARRKIKGRSKGAPIPKSKLRRKKRR
jgi:ribonuclease R